MMTKLATCNGDGCAMKMICDRYVSWMVSDEDEPDIPALYKDGECVYYIKKEFYGQ